MARGKRNTDEKLTPANLEKVIALLEPADGSKPISKKDACAILNISYNTSRLQQLIEKHKEKVERDAKKRAEKRGKPVTLDEEVYIVQEYINGADIENISSSIYRGTTIIKRILEKNGVPIRQRTSNYFKPELIPDVAVRDRFKVGEVVYSARYDSTATVKAEFQQGNIWVYRIWLLAEKWQQYAMQPAEELASLEHITKLGVRV